ncbi:MAG: PD40 domain-containing protein [Brasilonema angustatum HA4187-MV1]|jgi:WD40 repeat protein/archaellum biogenesis ATPase FlaH|nr:PD40 domain-containing protein [Brasilonema angustatum HA4187-MV1]
MTNDKSEDIRVNNERSLKQLAWGIEASVGQFKLILARCNYASLRSHLINRLRDICQVEIRVLVLKESARTLYTAIREESGDDVQALMILGLESVRNLEQMLISANQVREEFRNHFPFPVVLWIDDEVHKRFMQFAPDLESWGTTKNFPIAPNELMEFLQEIAEQLLTADFSLTLEKCSEIKLAWQDLQNSEQILESGVKARIAYLLGLTEFVDNHLDTALEYYQQSLAFWQQVNDLVWQGKVLSNITFCYYEKARQQETNRPVIASETKSNETISPATPVIASGTKPNRKISPVAPVIASGTKCSEAISPNVSTPDWQETKNYLQQSLQVLETAQRSDLIANLLDKFGKILRDLEDWQDLKKLAERALLIHEAEGNLLRVSQDYGFLAEVALVNQEWQEAKTLAEKALEVLSTNQSAISNRQEILLTLAQAEQNLGEEQAAINYLKIAIQIGISDFKPELYLSLLTNLRSLYLKQKQYLEAFQIKQEGLSVEQQFGLRAFIGAGRLQATRHANLSKIVETLPATSIQENIAPEISASGRLLDVERLIERIGRPDYKLIVIHGQSGVGKSSLVNAGLVPALKKKAIGIQDNLVVPIRVYTNWMEELGRQIKEALHYMGRGEAGEQGSRGDGEAETSALETQAQVSEVETPELQTTLLKQLRQCETFNLRPVLIFDQFEEFFFVDIEPQQRWLFFHFLRDCLNILSVKIVLSLREDYLHYLLKFNRLRDSSMISIDILSENVLYELGNFSRDDAQSIIQQLTERANFHLEPALIAELVRDLARELGEVRPIELQVVGAQLQAENITTLAKYQECGTKEELVKRYLDEVVQDCGEENQQTAEFVLYLLTDEKGTRPLKTRVELERDLQALAADVTREASKLDLILEIFVESGLVVLLKENPANRYQLVHDYLAEFIRHQQEPKLSQVMAELERERKERRLSERKLNRFLRVALAGSVAAGLVLAGLAVTAWDAAQRAEKQKKQAEISEIKALRNSSEGFFASGQTFDALIEALKAGERLKKADWTRTDTKIQVVAALRRAVYDVKEYNRLEGHSSWIISISFSPDGKTLASASDDRTIELWDVASGKPLKTLSGHTNFVRRVVFSPDGKTLASASDDRTIKLWDMASGKPLQTLSGHTNSVNSVSFSPDGRTLASASADRTIKLWDVATGKQLQTLSGHSNSVNSVSFSPDGKTLASASNDKTIKFWDMASGKQLQTLSGHSNSVNSVSFSPDGKTLASASADRTIKFWDAATGKRLQTLNEHSDAVTSISFSPDGKTLASASYDQTIKLWDVATGKLLQTLYGHGSMVNSVSFSPDNKTLASTGDDKTIKLWDIATDKRLQTLNGHQKTVSGVSFSPDGKTLASASYDRTIKLWDVATGKQLQTLTGHSDYVKSVSFSPDSKTLASASDDRTIKLWDVATGKRLQTLTGHSDYVNSVSFSPDSKTLASASGDKTIKLWDVATGKQLQTLTGHSDYVNSVSFSPDRKMLASASDDKTIKLWDVATDKLLQTLYEHSSTVKSISFSPDGKTLASASSDSTVKLLDVATGKLLQTLIGHGSWVEGVSFSPDGKTLASAGDDRTIKLWDVATGKDLQTLKLHNNVVTSVSFSPDGKTLASASADKTVILWNFNLADLLISSCNWLNKYLATHPEMLEELKECQTESILVKAAPALVARGEELAQNGNINAAVNKFRKAQTWNPSLKFDPKAKAQEFANKGQAERLVMEGKNLATEGKVKEAIANYQKAQKLDLKVEIDAESWALLCGYGSLHRHAADVMFACEKAVQLAPDNGYIRGNRGLARSLTGNTQGAIEDFEAYIAQIDDKKWKSKVQGWVKDLRAGKNPFTDAELKKLLQQ